MEIRVSDIRGADRDNHCNARSKRREGEIEMIESICCTLLVLTARITAGVYQEKFTFLSQILVPLNVAIIILAIVTAVIILFKILYAIKGRL